MRHWKLAVALSCVVCWGGSQLDAQGADVIVGDLHQVNNYGSAGDHYAYAVGTVSCNIGNVVLDWIAGTNEHPVIGQSMYRLKDGRFEHIGMSWLKHGFTALQQNLCQPCNANPSGNGLGVGCSDPYSAGLNGSQDNGPRSEVNATTGFFPFPYQLDPPVTDVTSRRLRVHADDVDPANNAGAQYWVEGQYVTPDDSAANNHHNNASYRKVTVGNTPAQFPLAFDGPTVREKAAIEVWPTVDPTVQLESTVVNGGTFFLGTKVVDLGNGSYSYEYALMNLNSDRSAGGFSIPVAASLVTTGVGFHDVDYHSGEELVYSQDDWTPVQANGELKWSTQTFAQNPNANALRWGTLYNFRFVTTAPPIPALATIDLFKPGGASTFTLATQAPDGASVAPIDTLVCANTGTGVDLSWNNGDVYDNLTVRRDNVVIATLPGNATSYSDTNLPDGNYSFTVQAAIGADLSAQIPCNVDVGLVHLLGLEDTNALAGQTGLRVQLTGGSIAFLDAYSVSIQYPNDLLVGVDFDFGPSTAQAVGADFLTADVGADFMTVEVVMDVAPFSGLDLPAGFNQNFGELVFDVQGVFNDGETRTLSFVNGLGSGVDNSFEENGVSFPPFTMDGTVTFTNAPVFIRGDCNSDGSLNLPDGIFLLNYLFAFGTPPTCFSGCDLDDNGSLQLPDAVVLLNYLFASGAAPAAPFPAAGPDPTPDSLVCL